MKRYVILAGVNGAGKSTLFSLISSLSEIEKIPVERVETPEKSDEPIMGKWEVM